MLILNLTQDFKVMKIAIVKRSKLNNCWSALQYNDSCVLCDKVITCKVKSHFHRNGLLAKLESEKSKILAEHESRLLKLETEISSSLKLFESIP